MTDIDSIKGQSVTAVYREDKDQKLNQSRTDVVCNRRAPTAGGRGEVWRWVEVLGHILWRGEERAQRASTSRWNVETHTADPIKRIDSNMRILIIYWLKCLWIIDSHRRVTASQSFLFYCCYCYSCLRREWGSMIELYLSHNTHACLPLQISSGAMSAYIPHNMTPATPHDMTWRGKWQQWCWKPTSKNALNTVSMYNQM